MKCGIAKLPLGFAVAATCVPGGYADFVRHMTRELQRCGLYRSDYAGTTLRARLPYLHGLQAS
jgi:hypothetical protein